MDLTHLEWKFRLRKNQVYTNRNWKLSQSNIISKEAGPFLKISFFRCFSHIFAIANQLPGFSISRLANVEDFFNVNMFYKNINVSINDNSFKYICVIYYLKLWFYCLISSAMSNLNSADFATPDSYQRF